jgi:hypothetical protein
MGLFDAIRNFADSSKGEWIKEYRHSSWINIGDLILKKQYLNVSFSKESCYQLGNDSSVCIFRSQDFSKLRNFYLPVLVDMGNDFVRVMGEREENMKDKFIDEKIYSKEQCFNVSFSNNPDLYEISADIINLGEIKGVAGTESWFFLMP